MICFFPPIIGYCYIPQYSFDLLYIVIETFLILMNTSDADIFNAVTKGFCSDYL